MIRYIIVLGVDRDHHHPIKEKMKIKRRCMNNGCIGTRLRPSRARDDAGILGIQTRC